MISFQWNFTVVFYNNLALQVEACRKSKTDRVHSSPPQGGNVIGCCNVRTMAQKEKDFWDRRDRGRRASWQTVWRRYASSTAFSGRLTWEVRQLTRHPGWSMKFRVDLNDLIKEVLIFTGIRFSAPKTLCQLVFINSTQEWSELPHKDAIWRPWNSEDANFLERMRGPWLWRLKGRRKVIKSMTTTTMMMMTIKVDVIMGSKNTTQCRSQPHISLPVNPTSQRQ